MHRKITPHSELTGAALPAELNQQSLEEEYEILTRLSSTDKLFAV